MPRVRNTEQKHASKKFQRFAIELALLFHLLPRRSQNSASNRISDTSTPLLSRQHPLIKLDHVFVLTHLPLLSFIFTQQSLLCTPKHFNVLFRCHALPLLNFIISRKEIVLTNQHFTVGTLCALGGAELVDVGEDGVEEGVLARLGGGLKLKLKVIVWEVGVGHCGLRRRYLHVHGDDVMMSWEWLGEVGD